MRNLPGMQRTPQHSERLNAGGMFQPNTQWTENIQSAQCIPAPKEVYVALPMTKPLAQYIYKVKMELQSIMKTNKLLLLAVETCQEYK